VKFFKTVGKGIYRQKVRSKIYLFARGKGRLRSGRNIKKFALKGYQRNPERKERPFSQM